MQAACGEEEFGAEAGEVVGERAAEVAARPGDDHAAAGEVHVVLSIG